MPLERALRIAADIAGAADAEKASSTATGKDSASLIASILKEEPRPISAGPVLPKSLDCVVRKCLIKRGRAVILEAG